MGTQPGRVELLVADSKPMARKHTYVDGDGAPLDEATLSWVFQPMSPTLFEDPVCGAELRRLAADLTSHHPKATPLFSLDSLFAAAKVTLRRQRAARV